MRTTTYNPLKVTLGTIFMNGGVVFDNANPAENLRTSWPEPRKARQPKKERVKSPLELEVEEFGRIPYEEKEKSFPCYCAVIRTTEGHSVGGGERPYLNRDRFLTLLGGPEKTEAALREVHQRVEPLLGDELMFRHVAEALILTQDLDEAAKVVPAITKIGLELYCSAVGGLSDYGYRYFETAEQAINWYAAYVAIEANPVEEKAKALTDTEVSIQVGFQYRYNVWGCSSYHTGSGLRITIKKWGHHTLEHQSIDLLQDIPAKVEALKSELKPYS